MNTLMVGYDLNQPGQDYDKLIDYLKSFGTYWHHLDSTWFLKTTMTAVQLRDELKVYVDKSDELLILNVSGDAWASCGFTDKGNDWLRNQL